MPPKFSLQPVLDFRNNRMDVLEIELGRLLQSQQRGQIFLDALKDSRGRILGQLGSQQQGDIDLFMVSRLQSSLETVHERIVEHEIRLQELAGQVKEKRQEVVLAKQDHEVLVILKDKEIDKYRLEQNHRENRSQDDIYISQAFRRSNGLA
jgi:flagellar export protein FliJ